MKRREYLQKGFELAVLLHGRRDTALEVLIDAIDAVRAAQKCQERRPDGPTFRRVKLHKTALLQLMILVESERLELEDEAEKMPCRDLLRIRYMAHLARFGLTRRAYHVALVLGRLLFDYSTDDVLRVLDVLYPSEDCRNDEAYCRATKSKAWSSLRQRFGRGDKDLLDPVRVGHGELRPRLAPRTVSTYSWTCRVLDMFVPWDTRCPVERPFDAFRQTLTIFGDNPSTHGIEVLRMHGLLHAPCFEKLYAAVDLDPPEQRLALPLFAGGSGGDTPPEGPGPEPFTDPPKLGPIQEKDIKRELRDRRRRRKHLRRSLLKLCIDGRERASLEPTRDRRVRLALDDMPGVVDVWAEDDAGRLLVARWLPGHWSEPEAPHAVTVSGRTLSLKAESTTDGTVWLLEHRIPKSFSLSRLIEGPKGRAAAWATAVVLAVALSVLLQWRSPDESISRPPKATRVVPMIEDITPRGAPMSLGQIHKISAHGPKAEAFARLVKYPFQWVENPETADAVLRHTGEGWVLVDRLGRILWSVPAERSPEEAAQALDRAMTD